MFEIMKMGIGDWGLGFGGLGVGGLGPTPKPKKPPHTPKKPKTKNY